jgi:hypothetical protein
VAVPRTLKLSGGFASDFRVMKRIDGNRNIWVVMNEAFHPRPVTLEFPGKGPVVRYDAERGRYETVSPVNRFSRHFAGGETAIFLTGDVPACAPKAEFSGRKVEIGGWSAKRICSYVAGKDDFEIKTCEEEFRPVRLGDWRPVFGDRFSGKVVYRAELDAVSAGKVKIDLGSVKWCALLKINCIDCGARFFGSFVWEAEVIVGKNVLEVTVANLLANQTGDAALRDRVIREFPPKSPYDRQQRIFDRENHDSGLYGPVVLSFQE